MARHKRVVALGDLHCGHRVGLTQPEYQWHLDRKYGRIQRECWAAYCRLVKQLRPVHTLMVLGDCIDGRGESSGGIELVTGDRNEQIKMAVNALGMWGAEHVVMARGTPYHVGQEEAFEDPIAKALGAKIGNHEWLKVKPTGKGRPVCFDLKHHIGGSQVPHGRATAVKRDEVWNALWAEAGLQPRGDWILRGHVHYCEAHMRFAGARQVWAMTMPALQAMGSRYGALRCSGLVDWGLVHWDIQPDGRVDWQPHVVQIVAERASATVV